MRMKCISRFYICSCPSCCQRCYVFVFFFFSRCKIFRHLSEEQTKRVVESSLGFIGLLRWDEKPGPLAQVFPKGFSQKGSDTNQRHEDCGNSYFCTNRYVEYLTWPAKPWNSNFRSFQTPRFDTKKYAKGDTDLWLCKPIDEGNTLEFLGHFFGWNWTIALGVEAENEAEVENHL